MKAIQIHISYSILSLFLPMPTGYCSNLHNSSPI